ncbi:MAG: hypothetical protein J7L50_02285 [Candidatus Odinarchaeota archaeon]|nr:hypothetical protein [Candidatus Odinarchaeota archaeon]
MDVVEMTKRKKKKNLKKEKVKKEKPKIYERDFLWSMILTALIILAMELSAPNLNPLVLTLACFIGSYYFRGSPIRAIYISLISTGVYLLIVYVISIVLLVYFNNDFTVIYLLPETYLGFLNDFLASLSAPLKGAWIGGFSAAGGFLGSFTVKKVTLYKWKKKETE